MLKNKYADDYRLENLLMPNGKLRTVAVYRGDRYRLSASEETLKKAKKALFPALIAAWGAFILNLCLNTLAARAFYVILPFFCNFFPIIFLTLNVLALRPGKPLKRSEADRLYSRGGACPLLMLLFSGAALAGDIVVLVRRFGEWGAPDAVFFAACAVFFACSIGFFALKKVFKCEKINTPAVFSGVDTKNG